MSLYTDIQAAVFVWTGRPDLTAETDAAIAQAIRKAHRAGTFWRDLVTVALTGLATDQVQSIDLATATTRFDQLSVVKDTASGLEYSPIDIRELLDSDGYQRANVYWIVGTTLNIRAASPSSTVTIIHYRAPITSPIATIDSWIASLYPDVVSLSAAATVLAVVGEQEIKTRVETLLRDAIADLVAGNTESVRR